MTATRKLERDFAYADLAAVNALLSRLTDEDIMTRVGLEARVEELQQSSAELEHVREAPTASALLFFGGRPVFGSRGIESEFAGNAVMKFQDIVAKVLADETGRLGQRGVVANKAAATLHITNIVRGSFGFLLEETQSQPPLLDSQLKTAVDDASRLLEAFGEPDEEEFRSAVETIDQRVLGTARAFFDLMRHNGATLRLVAGNLDRSFGVEAVERAADRATSTSVEDAEETLAGQLAGVLPDAHQFEFRTAEQGTIRGRVDRTLKAAELAGFNKDWVNVDALARVIVRRVRSEGAVVRETYTLAGLDKFATD